MVSGIYKKKPLRCPEKKKGRRSKGPRDTLVASSSFDPRMWVRHWSVVEDATSVSLGPSLRLLCFFPRAAQTTAMSATISSTAITTEREIMRFIGKPKGRSKMISNYSSFAPLGSFKASSNITAPSPAVASAASFQRCYPRHSSPFTCQRASCHDAFECSASASHTSSMASISSIVSCSPCAGQRDDSNVCNNFKHINYSSFAPLGSFALLCSFSRLVNFSSPGNKAWIGNFAPLSDFAPIGPCPALGSSLQQLLLILFGMNTVPAVLLTITFLPRFMCIFPCSLLAPSLFSLPAPICGPRLQFTWMTTCFLYSFFFSLCHTECSHNNTHSSPQRSTVKLHQPVFESFKPVTPALVMPGTRLSHLSQCYPSSTRSASHHSALNELAYTDANTGFPLEHSTFIQSVSRHPAHACTYSATQHFHNLHVNTYCGSESCHL